MSKDYNDMTLEELTALSNERKKKKLIEAISKEDADKEATIKLENDTKVGEAAVAKYLEENPPKPKLNEIQTVTRDENDAPSHIEYFNKRIKASGLGYVDYAKQEEFNYASSDAGCEVDASDWKKEDVFTKLVWHNMYCTAGLREICVKGIDVKAGDGLKVQIRTVGKFSAPANVSACTCLSCEAPALSVYSLTIGSYGLLTEICELDVFSIGEVLRSSIIEALAKRWDEYFDAQIYAQVATGFTPGNTKTLSVDVCPAFDFSTGTGACTCSCCTDAGAYFFNAIINLEAAMREGTTPYSPDYLIISPTVAAILKGKDGIAMPYIMQSQIRVEGGILTKVGSLKVIEYCGANTCASGATLAVMLDSRRAVGFAFGKPPRMEQDRNIDCDSTTVAMWCYFGTSELDVSAIGHIVNGS